MKASVWSPQPQEFPLSILCWFPAGQGNCQPGAASATFLESPKADTSATATSNGANRMRSRINQPLGSYRQSCETSARPAKSRSEEHTSELQSPDHLVC